MRAPPVTPTRQRIAAQAARDPERGFTTLAPLIDEDCLREAYRHPSKSRAAGIDGVRATMYAAHLEENLHDWHERLRSGRYQAAPVARVWLEQDDGGQRPIGKPAFEDKMVQRAGAMLREAMYEPDVHDGASGFRQGRSPHDARRARRERCRTEGIGGSGEAEGRGYVESIDRARLRAVVRKRVNDGGIVRLRGKWLRAGVREEGGLRSPESGVVQGGGMSPVLSNLFLHHVRDEWFEREVRPRRKGSGFWSRFADDFILGCEREAAARRIRAVLPKRFARFGLRIHPEKTAVIAFRKPQGHQETSKGNGTFDCLGLTHDWSRSRRGYWVSKRRTASKRLRRTKKAVGRWCHANRHAPVKYQYRMLGQKLRGHFPYYGIRGHFRLLEEVRRDAEKAWRYWLSRRSSKSALGWEQFQRLLQTSVLPTPKIGHNI